MGDHQEISHREIYERVISLEQKVDGLKAETANVVQAFNAAQGAFTVLEFLAKLAKPLLFIGALGATVIAMWDHLKIK